MTGSPSHFERQNGEPVWFLGDTAWGYVSDSPEDQHDRGQAEHYVRTRAGQGFNVIHVMLMSEQGVGNNGGPPFDDIGAEKMNSTYWQEVDRRLRFANEQGLTVGLALAPRRGWLLVANSTTNTISLLELAGGRQVARVPVVRMPHLLAVAPDERMAVVGNRLPAGDASDPVTSAQRTVGSSP